MKKRKISNNLIAILIIIFGIIISYNNWLIYKNAERLAITGFVSETATLELCFNNRPSTDSICATTATVGTLYTCDLSVADNDNNNLTFTDNATIFDVNSSTGIISFTPNSSQIGLHIINLSASDNSGCENNFGSSILELTVKEAPPAPAEEAVPSAAAPSAGTGGGGGAFPTKEPELEQPTLIPSFIVDKDLIKVTLKQEETTTRTFSITNDGTATLELKLDVEDLSGFIILSDYSITLEPNEKILVTLDITAPKDIDVYHGKILIEAESIKKSVAILIEVKSKIPLFDTKVKLPKVYKKVKAGKDIEGNINIINSYDQPIEIKLYYAIRDLDGNVISFNEEVLKIVDELSVIRKLKLPQDIKQGKYIFYVRITYNGDTAISSDLLKVVEPRITIPLRLPFSLMSLLIILMIITSIITFFNLRAYRDIKSISRKIKEIPKEIKGSKSLVKCHKLILKSYKALKAGYNYKAKSLYLKAREVYMKLPNKEKEKIYYELMSLHKNLMLRFIIVR